jgi:hypothetical protein
VHSSRVLALQASGKRQVEQLTLETLYTYAAFLKSQNLNDEARYCVQQLRGDKRD